LLIIPQYDIVVFWGSQSGTAEGFAKRLAKDFHRLFGISAYVADLQDYDPKSIAEIPNEKYAIFILSTYGEGDPSDNATPFVSWLSSHQSIIFSNLKYAAFGLGNSKYKYYNKVVDIVVNALELAQATEIMPTGRADDANGSTEEDFIQWKTMLFSLFCERLNYTQRPDVYEPVLSIIDKDLSSEADIHTGIPLPTKHSNGLASELSHIRMLPVKEAKALIIVPERGSLHVELDISDYPELKYKTGDHLAVWPTNPTDEVTRLISALGLEQRKSIPMAIFSLDADVCLNIPYTCTLETMFQHYLEICAPVSREVIRTLAQFASSATTKERLEILGSDKDAYNSFRASTHLNFGRLLEMFGGDSNEWNLPLTFVLESIPPLAPRYYSISSSSIVQPKRISITVSATVPSLTNAEQIHVPGLTTAYLTNIANSINTIQAKEDDSNQPSVFAKSGTISNDSKVVAQIRTSKFRLPTLQQKPVIMIATGSGIAPFRAFVQERLRLFSMGRPVGPSMLFFGCRTRPEYLYSEEFAQAQKALGDKLEIVLAVSGDEKNPEGGRMYVQDRIEEFGERICEMLVEGEACLYICGSAAMARDVQQRTRYCLKKNKGLGEEELDAFSATLKKGRRWQEDVWG
jgi:NADPH-ferrihemoprotein reductase